MAEPSIKIVDIAKAAKLSPSTVSFVLNGRGDALHISKKTQERVQRIASEMGYQPNISAKKLRHADLRNLPTLMIFCGLNGYVNIMPKTLQGLHRYFTDHGVVAEFSIKPYLDGQLCQEFSEPHMNLFHGAMIFGATDADICALEKLSITTPVVLLGRSSAVFSSVTGDQAEMGERIAALFHQRGHRQIGLVSADTTVQPQDQRRKAFLEGCDKYGMQIAPQNNCRSSFNFSGGEAATRMILGGGQAPTAIFYMNHVMAVGALTAFREEGIRIPEDMEIMTFGDNEYLEYTQPRISSVFVPTDDMAYSAIGLLLELISRPACPPVSRVMPSQFVIRESCGFSSNTD